MPNEKIESLTDAQARFAIACMSKWIQVRIDNNRNRTGPTPADVDHSALLYRLLSGKPLLEKAPPLSMSCPDYDLAEGKEVTVLDTPYELPEPHRQMSGEFCICINQHVGYKWYDKNAGILQHRNGDYFRYTPDPNHPQDEHDETKKKPCPAGTLRKINLILIEGRATGKGGGTG